MDKNRDKGMEENSKDDLSLDIEEEIVENVITNDNDTDQNDVNISNKVRPFSSYNRENGENKRNEQKQSDWSPLYLPPMQTEFAALSPSFEEIFERNAKFPIDDNHNNNNNQGNNINKNNRDRKLSNTSTGASTIATESTQSPARKSANRFPALLKHTFSQSFAIQKDDDDDDDDSNAEPVITFPLRPRRMSIQQANALSNLLSTGTEDQTKPSSSGGGNNGRRRSSVNSTQAYEMLGDPDIDPLGLKTTKKVVSSSQLETPSIHLPLPEAGAPKLIVRRNSLKIDTNLNPTVALEPEVYVKDETRQQTFKKSVNIDVKNASIRETVAQEILHERFQKKQEALETKEKMEATWEKRNINSPFHIDFQSAFENTLYQKKLKKNKRKQLLAITQADKTSLDKMKMKKDFDNVSY